MSGERASTSPIYLDWNATTPLHPDVLGAMQDTARDAWANPSSVHAAGRRARAVIESAREAVAVLVGVDPRDVILTSGATEANNLALRGAPALVTSRIEHPSVVRVAEALSREGRLVRWVPVPTAGRIEPGDVEAAVEGLSPGFVVALMAANHETGVLQPVTEVFELVRRCGGRLHVDAAQAAGKLEPAYWATGTSISLAAHKIRGPKGIGALVMREGAPPAPVVLGGAQERGIRPGTVDPVAASGFGAAARRAAESGPQRYGQLASLRDRFEAALEGHALRNGDGVSRLSHVSNLSFEGWRGDELVAALDLEGLCVSSGSACSAGSHEPSPVIAAMLGTNRAESAVRVSLGDETTDAEISRAISVVLRVVARGSFSRSSVA